MSIVSQWFLHFCILNFVSNFWVYGVFFLSEVFLFFGVIFIFLVIFIFASVGIFGVVFLFEVFFIVRVIFIFGVVFFFGICWVVFIFKMLFMFYVWAWHSLAQLSLTQVHPPQLPPRWRNKFEVITHTLALLTKSRTSYNCQTVTPVQSTFVTLLRHLLHNPANFFQIFLFPHVIWTQDFSMFWTVFQGTYTLSIKLPSSASISTST